ncbi:MAG: FtsW/RodA/SpoVE family cell cycle protein [Alphaproteobacteria bacterium]|jgi:cell division protein FtsW|nr:putative lipid II flippase FtsW [Alphaproteobacteria bacterium]
MNWLSRADTSPLGRWWWTVDRWTLAGVIALMGSGFFLTMAASPAVAEHLKLDAFYFVKRHAFFMLPVLGILVGVSLLSLYNIKRLTLLVYVGCLGLLLITPLLGVEIKGAKRWLSVVGFSFQPSEFVKPVLTVLVAWMLAESKKSKGFPGYLAALVMYTLVVGLLLLQPDMGMIILLTAVTFLQFFLAGLPVIWVIVAIALGAAGLMGSYFVFSHVRARVDRFLDPGSGDKFTDRYQITQSLEAFVNGGMWGRGPGEGTVKSHLPDAHADFIFAVAGEEFGFILCSLIVCLFAFVVLRSLVRVMYDENLFIILAVAGLILQFGLQALINMASTLSLIPTKGMTLPFISYGGSSMMAMALNMGLVMALTRRRLEGEKGA